MRLNVTCAALIAVSGAAVVTGAGAGQRAGTPALRVIAAPGDTVDAVLGTDFTCRGFTGAGFLAYAVRGFFENGYLIVTSDHGGVGTFHGTDSPEEITIPWLAVGPGVPAGIILPSDIVMYDTAATALHALNIPIPEVWDGRPVLEIFGER